MMPTSPAPKWWNLKTHWRAYSTLTTTHLNVAGSWQKKSNLFDTELTHFSGVHQVRWMASKERAVSALKKNLKTGSTSGTPKCWGNKGWRLKPGQSLPQTSHLCQLHQDAVLPPRFLARVSKAFEGFPKRRNSHLWNPRCCWKCCGWAFCTKKQYHYCCHSPFTVLLISITITVHCFTIHSFSFNRDHCCQMKISYYKMFGF